jgi:hypothetical protein
MAIHIVESIMMKFTQKCSLALVALVRSPTNSAQATDDHCHCMRWPLSTLQAVCAGFLGASTNGCVENTHVLFNYYIIALLHYCIIALLHYCILAFLHSCPLLYDR